MISLYESRKTGLLLLDEEGSASRPGIVAWLDCMDRLTMNFLGCSGRVLEHTREAVDARIVEPCL
jgi:hypothetical protein